MEESVFRVGSLSPAVSFQPIRSRPSISAESWIVCSLPVTTVTVLLRLSLVLSFVRLLTVAPPVTVTFALGTVTLAGSLANTPPVTVTELSTVPVKVPPAMVPVPDTLPLKVPPSMALPLATVTSALVVMLETVVLVSAEPMVI